MTDKKYSLPPRKWYTLEQAIKRIQKLTGEELEIADLLHYWAIGKVNLSVYFSHYPYAVTIGNKISKNQEERYIHIFSEPNIEGELEDIFSIRSSYKNTVISDEIKITITADTNTSDDFVYIKGFMNISSSIENTPFGLSTLEEKGVSLTGLVFLSSPHSFELDKVIIQLSFVSEKEIYLPLKELVLLEDDLEEFLRDRTIKLDLSNLNKGGRPPLKMKTEIIEKGYLLFNKNPDVNRESITNAILDYFAKKDEYPTACTVRRYLSENKIGIARGKSKRLKI